MPVSDKLTGFTNGLQRRRGALETAKDVVRSHLYQRRIEAHELFRHFSHVGEYDDAHVTVCGPKARQFERLNAMLAVHDVIDRGVHLQQTKRQHALHDFGNFDLLGDGLHFLVDVQRALEKLPTEQREMLMLVAADMSYEEAAEITGCAIGTVKSRIARGRVALKRLLGEGGEGIDQVPPKPGQELAGDR